MNMRSIVKALSRLLFSAVAALALWVALSNSPLALAAPDAQHGKDHDHGQHTAAPADHKAGADQGHGAEAKKDHHGGDHTPGGHLEPNALHHVMDTHKIELFGGNHIDLPPPLTKFMVLELIAALLICAIYIPLARKIQNGGVIHGVYGNFFEVLLTFVREQVAKPGIGEHDADKYVPFLWTLFLFILFNNLLGMVPLGGSPTASIYVTAGLALCVFGYMHGSGIARMGLKNYALSLWPHIDVPMGMGYVIKPLIFVIEWVGVLVRNAVLAVRLFANMFAGHMVLATILIFIWMARHASPALWGTITASSVLGIVLLSLLELFVAFLQAYIFTFLTSLFMGMALHPEH